jgi:arsenical pump membrane protein
VHDVAHHLSTLVPALAFLLAAVPLAALLGRLGFFDAVTSAIASRTPTVPVSSLWLLAAVTTVVLNLDTTVVLLTPLYLRLARRAGVDPVPLLAVPLLLASLASSVLPVSNLTTLVAVDQLHLSVADVVGHLALPSLAASTVGWFVYRRVHPVTLRVSDSGPADRRALLVGGAIVIGLLVGFTVGPSVGLPSWSVALGADLVLVAVTRTLPWRSVPLATALLVAAVAALVALVVPGDHVRRLLGHDAPLALVAITGTASLAANAVNNLPALFVGLGDAHRPTWGLWAWLLGVNTGAVLLPLGALANLLWHRILRAEGIVVRWRTHLRLVAPVALPALAVAAATLAIERALVG